MTQLAQGQIGDDINVAMKFKEGGIYINITTQFKELYIFISDASRNVLARYSKVGTPINGNNYTALLVSDDETYYFWLDSSITKVLQEQILTMDINIIQNESDLTDTNYNLIGRFQLIKMNDNLIKILS